ncbi:DUF6787 family protein [Fodinibius sediminis]|uniref:DUF6787 domain-containing protein n=1 Tax=Fodinibius sediminis TaxID=1214077 RepID=A0A521DXH7_9BACT|nr:DUF6787 family protein [Fodinibius sediminis]SMO76407.1 hypothetical protein SAMN06265218_11242 [Fodinibius sediminis]
MQKLLDHLKNRWGLTDSGQVALILFIFSISGMSVLYIRRFVFNLLGFGKYTPFWEEAAAWLLVVVPSYQILLLLYGTILGQFEFVWHFEKKNFSRLKKWLSKLSAIFCIIIVILR